MGDLASLVIHNVLTALVLIFGLTYSIRNQFMPYHSSIVQAKWSDVPFLYQILIRSYMIVIGGAWVSIGISMLVLAWIPFREGALWSRWALFGIEIVVSTGTLLATLIVRKHTSAKPPTAICVVAQILTVIALIISI